MSLKLPENEWYFQVAKSSGPGGQKVNKTNTKAILKWNIVESSFYSEKIKQKIIQQNQTLLNDQGEIVIASQEHRTQILNKDACILKLKAILEHAHKKEKVRKKTKPSKSSIKKRLESKGKRSDIKKNRKKIDY